MARPLRYNVILALAAIATALAGVGGWRYARASAPINGPIVLLSIDTLRADHLPAYGYTRVRTPAIDALAADAVVFDRAYAHATETLPAHVAMLSGRLPFDTGVRTDAARSVQPDATLEPSAAASVKPTERLLPQLLHERGYATAGIVSTARLSRRTGIQRGFDFFDDRLAPTAADADPSVAERSGPESETIAEHWLDSVGTSRAFLFLHINEPHAPYAPPERFAGLAPYDGEIAAADEVVGRLVHYLKAHQLYDQSTIVLVSDHGEGLGDHGELRHGLFVYDEAIHIPLIVKAPAGEGAGRRVADVVQQVDLVPTILDLVKAPLPGGLRGQSLKPLLDGASRAAARPVYAEAQYGQAHFGWAGLTSIFDGRYHYISAPRPELYDLQRDPHERVNLIGTGDAPRAAQTTLSNALTELAGGKRPAELVGNADAETAPAPVPVTDPKDAVDTLERYRSAEDLARDHKWTSAIAVLQRITRDDETLAEVWMRQADYAMRIERFDLAAAAYARAADLRPDEAQPLIGAAAALLKLRKLDEARDRATSALETSGCDDAIEACRARDVAASAHAILARIAVNRHDADEARTQAALAREADPALPMPAFIDGRLLFDQGNYEEALPLFEAAIAETTKGGRPSIPDVHHYAADALMRLDRLDAAEQEYLAEIREHPESTHARSELVQVYQAMGRLDEAGRAIDELIEATPTPETYALASRLWTTLGNRRQADAVRAEARRAFGSR